jgi:hypothetical protein
VVEAKQPGDERRTSIGVASGHTGDHTGGGTDHTGDAGSDRCFL